MSFPFPDVPMTEDERASLHAFDEVSEMHYELLLLDFAAADQGEFTDKPMPYVYYYGRVHEAQHQRVSLITHPTSGRGEFLQAVVQVYDKAPPVGRPKGAPPRFLHADGPRCWEDLLAAVSRVYPLLKS